jgi:hypothetical protein
MSLVRVYKCSVTACAKVAIVKYVMNTILTHAHTLQFNFHTVTNQQAIDALVHALSIELFINNRIECSQPTADRLEFSTDAHCMLAQLALSNDSRFSLLRL